MVGFLMWLKEGYTKYPDYLPLCDRREFVEVLYKDSTAIYYLKHFWLRLFKTKKIMASDKFTILLTRYSWIANLEQLKNISWRFSCEQQIWKLYRNMQDNFQLMGCLSGNICQPINKHKVNLNDVIGASEMRVWCWLHLFYNLTSWTPTQNSSMIRCSIIFENVYISQDQRASFHDCRWQNIFRD